MANQRYARKTTNDLVIDRTYTIQEFANLICNITDDRLVLEHVLELRGDFHSVINKFARCMLNVLYYFSCNFFY